MWNMLCFNTHIYSYTNTSIYIYIYMYRFIYKVSCIQFTYTLSYHSRVHSNAAITVGISCRRRDQHTTQCQMQGTTRSSREPFQPRPRHVSGQLRDIYAMSSCLICEWVRVYTWVRASIWSPAPDMWVISCMTWFIRVLLAVCAGKYERSSCLHMGAGFYEMSSCLQMSSCGHFKPHPHHASGHLRDTQT